MNLVPVNIESIRLRHPLPFSLRDEGGVLLAHKGFVVNSREELSLMIGQRGKLFIDVAESESQHRAYLSKLHDLVREERPLGQIAGAQMTSGDLDQHHDAATAGEPDWMDVQEQTHAMLRDTNPASFASRLQKLQTLLLRQTRNNPDGTIFALIYLSNSELQMYSATHALLVTAMCSLAAHEVLKWSEDFERSLCNAALTMNISIGDLQDRLVFQKESPTPEQRAQIDLHCANSVKHLQRLGVGDAHWLDAVAHHHSRTPGALADRPPSKRMARLIQRADLFAARIAPRSERSPDSPASAMQACYFDENRAIDEAGAALIKAVGIYSPGTFVRLSTDEIAVVVKRGANTTTPRVAVLINRNGMPTGELILRDTSRREFRIVTSVSQRDVKVQINLPRMLALAHSSA